MTVVSCVYLHHVMCDAHVVMVCGGAVGPSLHPPTLLVLWLPPSQDVPPAMDPAPIVVDTVSSSQEHVGGVAGESPQP